MFIVHDLYPLEQNREIEGIYSMHESTWLRWVNFCKKILSLRSFRKGIKCKPAGTVVTWQIILALPFFQKSVIFCFSSFLYTLNMYDHSIKPKLTIFFITILLNKRKLMFKTRPSNQHNKIMKKAAPLIHLSYQRLLFKFTCSINQLMPFLICDNFYWNKIPWWNFRSNDFFTTWYSWCLSYLLSATL